jgi:hypothetical protein
MANRWLNQFTKTLEKEVCHLYLRVTFGASGAPTISAANSKGIASIARSAQGVFLVTFQDSWYKLLGVNGVFVAGSAGPAAPTISVSATGVTTIPGTITLLTQNGGVDTDPASGEVLYAEFVLGNSSAI